MALERNLSPLEQSIALLKPACVQGKQDQSSLFVNTSRSFNLDSLSVFRNEHNVAFEVFSIKEKQAIIISCEIRMMLPLVQLRLINSVKLLLYTA